MWPKGAAPVGSDHWKAILNEGQVKKIKLLIIDGLSNGEIANEFNCSRDSINKIRTNKTWRHVCLEN